MAAMIRARLAFAALWLALAGCGDDGAPPRPPPRPPPPPAVAWVATTLPLPDWDLEIHVPKDWSKNHRFFGEGKEVWFGGPPDDGWEPQVMFGWEPGGDDLDAWGGRKIRAFEGSPNERVVRKGSASVGGMPAVFCVYSYEWKPPGGAPKEMIAVAFFFVGHGHRGYVRGSCTSATSPRYLPIFEEAAARVRYSPK
jgi:hypothetical protein